MTVLRSFVALVALQFAVAAPQVPNAGSVVKSDSQKIASRHTSLTTEEIDKLFNLHEELVNIPSISEDEVECANFLSEYLTGLGYYVDEVPVGDTGTFNVFAYPQALKDEGTWPEVLITSHIDTVPPFYPFERREENGTVYHYGRGTVDAKGPIATMIIATHKFFQSRTDTPSLGMLFVVSEEIGGTGMKAFAKYASNMTFRAGIFGEPTEGKLASGHKGSLRVDLNVTGKAAHSAYPWLGVSAINYLAEAIMALNMLEPALPSSELLGATTLNAGRIMGGVAGNVVPEHANASIVVRIARSEDDAVEVVKDMMAGMLSPIASRAKEANATFNVLFANTTYPAPILDTDIEGLEVAPVFYGTDIPSLPQVEKKYLYGTGTIEVAHTDNEGLSQDELIQAAEAYGMILESLFAE
ncbi:ArgE Acetylornithine deacetylase Succinyl-diaminopimelate desuccinylase [Pyrenophora tritici-repentis]|uniref:Acetyl-lysine deacetylase n=2 Tax=Pyrenophora tritici-repentis TaxID=45151 RepID=A0A2W1DUR0_9PLEO|nr:acetyl-lysine deacetylase [Pyrenophora tritici-repentis Pt-1C-BFP]KAA8615706.1 Acetyl-lysine deacetylase [Pyrenophora tritici-repentis]EDU51265.1 acetyl-lysine deacetylase [Pyrenophora tritici-repentis Pt-1C-BFP]KAF7443707.1 Acetyl-lysine deacetylase [Pyrenophora tritici-repentis]KAG9379447.1 Acetyl-lysine deacetylase [Pyrenophora tritici-repentis]KAI1519519.1 Acetyl-lysine deacetylase [Pyrenophora tritici-repentis]